MKSQNEKVESARRGTKPSLPPPKICSARHCTRRRHHNPQKLLRDKLEKVRICTLPISSVAGPWWNFINKHFWLHEQHTFVFRCHLSRWFYAIFSWMFTSSTRTSATQQSRLHTKNSYFSVKSRINCHWVVFSRGMTTGILEWLTAGNSADSGGCGQRMTWWFVTWIRGRLEAFVQSWMKSVWRGRELVVLFIKFASHTWLTVYIWANIPIESHHLYKSEFSGLRLIFLSGQPYQNKRCMPTNVTSN